jgi:hypothetical protein
MSFIDIPTFDGILSYAVVRDYLKKNGRSYISKTHYDAEEMPPVSEMPITLHKNGYFLASQMFFDKSKAVEDTQRWRKRWHSKDQNLADFGGKMRQVEIQKGHFKSFDVPFSSKTVKECWFFFNTDDIKKVKQLVAKWIFFLGKKRAQGFGEILSFEITEAEFDFNTIFRPIPCELADADAIIRSSPVSFRFCAWKYPYWDPANFTKCVISNQ